MKKAFSLEICHVENLLERLTSFMNEWKSKWSFPVNIPTSQQLSRLIEVAFWASLRKEEGKEISFQLSFCPQCAFRFQNPKLFDIANIAKLAPALNPKELSIIVWSKGDEQIKILGFDTPNYNSSLQIKTFEPGKILAQYSKLKAVVTGDSFEYLKVDSQLVDMSVNSALDQRTKDEYKKAYSKLANYIWKLNQGGTLLIVPDDLESSIELPISYSNGEYSQVKEYLDMMIAREKEIINEGHSTNTPSAEIVHKLFFVDEDYAMNKYWYDESLTQIAQFTAIDGATIITNNLKVLGFGAKIRPRDSQDIPESVFTSDVFEGSESKEKSIAGLGWGTRHKSAAQFVYDLKEALAIVASQDGKLSIMAWSKEKEMVSVFTPAEYLFA